MSHPYDAIVIGSGPNGLSAAIALAQAGWKVAVYEANEVAGGGTRSARLTLPGFLHDVCSAVHPLALASPFFCTLPLAEHGLRWIHPPVPLAHPLENGQAVVLHRSVDATAEGLHQDQEQYQRVMKPLVSDWEKIENFVLGPLRFPRHPWAVARFGLRAFQPAHDLAKRLFAGERARALFAGLAAHSALPLEMRPSAAFGLVLGLAAHTVGWPIPDGGSQSIADALASYLRTLGGEIFTNSPVHSLDDLPAARAILCDLTPRQALQIARKRLPARFQLKLENYRYGPAAYKVDWALNGPVPWQAPECRLAATVHLGGTLQEIAASERSAWYGKLASKPFVLLAQPSLFDPSRSPAGKHTAWAYCHAPNGSEAEMTERIEEQVERFAPGFRQLIAARSVMKPLDLEQHNANLVGGDINGGAQNLGQLFLRPTRWRYRTPCRGLYLCSSSTPPGGGVHGMCGYFAAMAVLKDCS